MILLLFTANGVFEPLEVALNRVWGISKNRSFLRNQLVSLLLIFACGGLALLSLAATAVHRGSLNGLAVDAWLSRIVLRIVSVPLAALILFLVYRYLPNELPHGRPPLNRVVPAAVGVGVLLEAMKVLMALLWPWMDMRIAREYGVVPVLGDVGSFLDSSPFHAGAYGRSGMGRARASLWTGCRRRGKNPWKLWRKSKDRKSKRRKCQRRNSKPRNSKPWELKLQKSKTSRNQRRIGRDLTCWP